MRTFRAIPDRLVQQAKLPIGVINRSCDPSWLVQEEHKIVPLANGQTTDWFFVARGTKEEMIRLLKVLEANANPN